MCNVKRRSITVPFSFFLASFRVLFWFVCFGSASVFPSTGSCFQHKQYKPTLRYQSNTRQQTDGRYWINSGAFSSLKSQTSQELVEIKQELKKNMYIQLKFSDWPELINVMFTACSAAFQVKSHHIILLWCTTTFLNWWCFFFFLNLTFIWKWLPPSAFLVRPWEIKWWPRLPAPSVWNARL